MKTRGRPKGTGNRSFQSDSPLGSLIRKARLKHKLGLAEVAATCKCSTQFISSMERGRATLPWSKAPALAKLLKIPKRDLHSANLSSRINYQELIRRLEEAI
jgi:transcriptional regulator with XRE-family HTH domain